MTDPRGQSLASFVYIHSNGPFVWGRESVP